MHTTKIIHFVIIFTFRTNFLIVEEANATVYLKVSRSNGLNVSVSVEWETVSDTAFGISTLALLSVHFCCQSGVTWAATYAFKDHGVWTSKRSRVTVILSSFSV